MHTIFILFTTPPPDVTAAGLEKVFGRYIEYYEQLLSRAAVYDTQYQITFLPWYDQARQSFTQVLTHTPTGWEIRATTTTPDLIYNKTSDVTLLRHHDILVEIASHVRFCNQLDFTILAGNKLYASLLFPDSFKPYLLATTPRQLQAIAAPLASDLVVIKQALGNSGEYVTIVPKTEVAQQSFGYPVLVQEFVDSTAGVPGIVQGMHDLRVMCFNDRIIHSYIRQPAPGKLLANIAQGGSVVMVESDRLPASVIQIVEQVQDRFQTFFPAIYTVDFIFDERGQPWILEINTKPGMLFPSEYASISEQIMLQWLEFMKAVARQA